MSTVPPGSFSDRFARFVLGRRALLLTVSFLISALSVWAIATKLRVDTSDDAFLSSDSEAARQMDRQRDLFGQDLFFQVLVEGDVFSPDYLERLRKLHEACERLDVEIVSLGARRRVSDLPEPNALSAGGSGQAGELDNAADGLEVTDDEFGDFGEDEGWGEEEGGRLFEDVISLVNVRRTTGGADGIRMHGLLDDWPSAEQLPALRKSVLSERFLVGQVVSADGRFSALVLRSGYMDAQDSTTVHEGLEALIAEHEAEGFHIQLAGLPAVRANILRTMMSDSGRLTGTCILITLILLALIFRRGTAVLGPVLAVIQSALWTLGLMTVFDAPFTVLTNILPAFLLCVGLGDSVHVISVQRAEVGAGREWNDAIRRAMVLTASPVLLTSVTTALGLCSLASAQASGVQQMGLFGGAGVMFALLQSLTTVPIFLSFARARTVEATSEGGWLTARCVALGNHITTALSRRVVLGVTALVVPLILAGLMKSDVSHNPLKWLPDAAPVKLALQSVDANLGGTADVALLVEPAKGQSFSNPALLAGLDNLEQDLRGYERHGAPMAGSSQSVLDLMRESRRALHGGGQDDYTLPTTTAEGNDLLALFQMAGPEDTRRILTLDKAASLMSLRLRWLDGRDYLPYSEYIEQAVQKHVGDLATVRVGGTVFTIFSVSQLVLQNLVRSFGLALVLITIAMMFVLRDVKLGLIAAIPNLLPVFSVLSLMAWWGIPLDMSNILISSIAIGICVDDTVHFFHHFKVAHDASGDVQLAIEDALRRAGAAMVITSLILLCGFSVFLLAGLKNMQLFGLLIGINIVIALAADLLLAPVLLRVFYRGR